MAGIGTPEILIVAVVVMALFGARRLPDSARALGRSMRIFKAETKGLHEDDTVVAPLPLTAPGAPQPRFDPYTGQPLTQEAQPLTQATPRFDPMTGQPLQQGQPHPDRQP